MDYQPDFVVPKGTQIVTNVEVRLPHSTMSYARGSVGIIVKSPPDNTHAYRVQFLDETEVTLHRREFTIRKQYQKPLDAEPSIDLYQYVIYRCVVGSRAYGLDHEESDKDMRGIYLPPADLHWSLYGVPEQLESPETQEAYWEFHKFMLLALKANPNVLECLYTPLVEYATPIAEELIGLREIFQTYNGYVMSQFRKIEQDIRNQGKVRWKHAMHLIRLLLSGIIALREGYIPLRVEAYREQLLAIRREEMKWDAVNQWRFALHREFDTIFASTSLPERPDYKRANEFLIKTRRRMTE